MKLIEEIKRCPNAFDQADDANLAGIANPHLRALLARKNGALALSGALLVFGLGPDPKHPMDRRFYRTWEGRQDYGLSPDDEIFGADIFGDLLFTRGDEAFRLEGEQGERVALGAVRAWLEQDRREAAEELGGNVARDRFAERVLGIDPLRLLPKYPFMMAEFVAGEFFKTPLSRALQLKLHLFRLCRDTPDGVGVDCSFWRE